MIREFSDEQIASAIKIVIIMIAAVILWVGASFVYKNYLKTDSKSQSQIEQALRKVKESPRNIQARVTLADLFLNNNRFDEAIKNYKEALKLNEKYEPALLGLGIAFQNRDDTDEALATFDKEISIATKGSSTAIDKYLEQAYFYKGQLLLDKGSFKEASQALDKAIEISPTMSDTHLLLGKAKIGLGKKEEAVEHLKKALQLNPGSTQAKEELKKLGN